MSYQVRFDGTLLRVDIEGDFPRTEFDQALAESEAHEVGLGRAPDRICDLSRVSTSETNYPMVAELGWHRQVRDLPNDYRVAFVATTPSNYGVARMVQAAGSNARSEVQIFATVAEAEAWLRSRRL